MSFELQYHPPKGTSFVWMPKALNYSPWTCSILKQKSPGWAQLWPFHCGLYVDKVKDKFIWRVDTCGFNFSRKIICGEASDALEACLAAEYVGEGFIKRSLPNWVRTALKNKWRPPAMET